MQIFGLDPLIAAVLIAVIGVAYSIALGYVTGKGGFNGKKLATSILISIPGSLILVATGIRAAETTDDLMTLILVIGWILQISGTDFTVKKIGSVINAKRN